jgi:hypothetical protein
MLWSLALYQKLLAPFFVPREGERPAMIDTSVSHRARGVWEKRRLADRPCYAVRTGMARGRESMAERYHLFIHEWGRRGLSSGVPHG